MNANVATVNRSDAALEAFAAEPTMRRFPSCSNAALARTGST